jgi:carbon-monoxide dehydrogenase small subunit
LGAQQYLFYCCALFFQEIFWTVAPKFAYICQLDFSFAILNKRGFDMNETISFQLNEKSVSLTTDGQRSLLWVLRTDLALTGTKCGCEKGLCGACTVIIDDRAVRSCIIPIRSVKGKEVLTIEGLASNGKLHPIQEVFIKHDALQCGFCTPGMILNAYSLLLINPKPTKDQIIRGMEGNLCRCGAHTRIVQAIQSAAKEMIRR